ncbi:flagellar protein FlgN [Endozoicomonas sp. GU-1]|uniref:flagellar protein FlgN n=2 Tax=Endozoicomonas sp. GU-1 TaxID=3009078 RepID=UPI0022B3FBA5|nr:flagellar protein FlgN [Endozoicomonas sp. GU-1]WBA85461.1 flagellar protein FlgN [Endozoicomonas sp. GU-1]
MNSTQRMTTDAKNASDASARQPAGVDGGLEDLGQKMLGNIQDALALSRKLERVLESVHQKMLERNITALEHSLETQIQLLNMLQMNGALREHYLKPLGLSPDQQGMSHFFSLVNQQPANASTVNRQALNKYWVQLEGSANRCQQINSANGRLLARLSASTRKIIALTFSGQTAATYDQNGLTVNSMAE